MSPGLATSARNLLGERVGAYIITSELARGGMGMVYEAVHETIGHRAAIKVLSASLSSDPQHGEFVGRFVDEARAVNVIQHPGIVKIFDIGTLQDSAVYIMMEFLEGESLWSRGRKLSGRRFPVRDALRITRQIASSLVAAHDKRIVHRDLKPENIILIADPEAPGEERTKVLDFGLARFLDSPQRRTAVGLVVGTAVYMSPEQCQGSEGIDGKMDVYALGVMLYEMLAGAPPFDGEPGPVMISHMTHPPPPLDERARAPEAVVKLCHQMLAKPAAERPTMADVAARIRQLEATPPADSPAAGSPAPLSGALPRVTETLPRPSAGPRRVQVPLWVVLLSGILLLCSWAALAARLLSRPAPQTEHAPGVAASPPLPAAAPPAQPATPARPVDEAREGSAPPPPPAPHGAHKKPVHHHR